MQGSSPTLRQVFAAELPRLFSVAYHMSGTRLEAFERLRELANLPLAPAGSNFEHAVWDAMLRIPYGRTRSYGEIARDIGGEARAVGGACGSNPIPIIIPCHRVLAANGRSGGYSGRGGTQTKHFLLALEGATLL